MAQAPAYNRGTGRRKTAVARVRLKIGTGEIRINDRPFQEYFLSERERNAIKAPLVATKAETRFDIFAQCHGGGVLAQSGAVLLGIARALVRADASLEPALRAGNFLTRDSRMKERKKYGQRSARANFQFSKR